MTGSTNNASTGHDDDVSDVEWVATLLRHLGRVVPALEDDPTARMLDLVPDRARQLDPAGLAGAMTHGALSVDQVADRLAARGWEVTGGQVASWVSRGDPSVCPALITAIAAVTGAQLNTLLLDRTRTLGDGLDGT